MRSERRASDRRAKQRCRQIIAAVGHKFGPINLAVDDFASDPKIIGRMVSKTSSGVHRCSCSRFRKLKLKKAEAHYGEEKRREVHG
jgi:hypothetical protein